ncbi:MAG TPA: queuosine precursor transporter [Syntrophomonadaceae bacterium]|nr:queuosine precursor transporter [Syntrophomonadaceae bacterium]HPR92732.1 queuosine precursor transporter [Syntrophomonadaceae bacterium]
MQESPKVSYLFVIIACIFISCLLLSNIIAGKLITIAGAVLPGAVILFPLAYILGDVLTEVYGFGKARLVIWAGFFCNLLMAGVFYLVLALPSPEFFTGGSAFALVLGMAPRIVLASLLAYWAGEFVNAMVLSRIKVFTRGRFLWLRTISSTLAGQALDTIIFITVSFWGTMPNQVLAQMILYQYLFKVTYEVAATPVTYAVTGWLKAREGLDTFDEGVGYNPFRLLKSR